MSAERSLSKITREELYDLVWSTPGSKLAADFGVSDVAIAKRCQKLGVPRPSRGYWARIAAGHHPERPPLPATPAELAAEAMKEPIPKVLSLPEESVPLHPSADELAKMVASAKPDAENRVHVRERTLPEVTVSKALAQRVAQAFHAILKGVEPRGIPFRRARSSYDPGYFEKGHDRLYLKIEEELIEQPPTSDSTRRRRTYWQPQLAPKIPSGRLTFSIGPERYGSPKQWTEVAENPIDAILAEIVKEICRHYTEVQKRRAAEAIEREKQRVESEERWRKQQAEQVIRDQEAKKQKHASTVEGVARSRKEDLVKAAEWWRLYRATEDFLAAAEQRWRNAQAGQLTPEQETWMSWARETSKGLSPFEAGYPDVAKDLPVDTTTIPVGGPYPELRNFPRPPTMPEIPPPVVQSGYSGYSSQSTPQPYPFWLKYPRR